MADKRFYIKLDVGYFDNPKVATVTRPTALLLHIASIAYSRRHLTDGRIPVELLIRQTIGAKQADADALFAAGMWVDLGDGWAEVHDYAEHQQMSGAIDAASKRGKSAAHARWNADRNASGMRNAMPEERRGEERTHARASARATRIPDDFAVTDAMRTWAAEKAPGVDLDRATQRFIDYWTGESGAKASKRDWVAAWRTWVGRDADRGGNVRPLRSTPTSTLPDPQQYAASDAEWWNQPSDAPSRPVKGSQSDEPGKGGPELHPRNSRAQGRP